MTILAGSPGEAGYNGLDGAPGATGPKGLRGDDCGICQNGEHIYFSNLVCVRK
jgi:hypothetical protein